MKQISAILKKFWKKITSVNPNTVIKAYKELEIRGNLETQQGTGTFISDAGVRITAREKKRLVDALCRDVIARAGAYGIELDEIIASLKKGGR